MNNIESCNGGIVTLTNLALAIHLIFLLPYNKTYGNFHVPCDETRHTWIFPCTLQRNIWHGIWKLPCTLRLNKGHGDFQRNIWQGTWKFPCSLQRNIWHGTWKFPYFAICFVASYKEILHVPFRIRKFDFHVFKVFRN